MTAQIRSSVMLLALTTIACGGTVTQPAPTPRTDTVVVPQTPPGAPGDERGAYVLADGDDAIIIATGSEVFVALAARENARGRVVGCVDAYSCVASASPISPAAPSSTTQNFQDRCSFVMREG